LFQDFIIDRNPVNIVRIIADLKTYLADNSPRTTEEAPQQAAERLADPNRKPISRHFGTHKGILGGDGVAYQRKIRDEWD
jgi:hypothetical protein